MSKLFTVCVTHYRQMKFVFNAIDSVLKQDYPNIELLVADDGSDDFDKKAVEKYIKENKKDNIKKVKVLANQKNIGTVKNLNNAIKNSTGQYITFFAADDELSNEKVISNYYNAFEKYDKYIITAQAYLYDKTLLKNEGIAVDTKKALKYNNMKPIDVFYYIAKSCFYASGATAYRKDIFDKLGMFDERYLLVEDWSYYLKLLKNNIQIYFVDFPALNHRDGGVSHTAKITPTVVKYNNDILKIYENELLNDMPNISDGKKMDIYYKCKKDVRYIMDFTGRNDFEKYDELINKSMHKAIKRNSTITKYKIYRNLHNFTYFHVFNKIRFLYRTNILFLINLLMWLYINIFVLNNYYDKMEQPEVLFSIFGSFVLCSFGIKALAKLGDLVEYCTPITFVIMHSFNSFGIHNSNLIVLISILIYFVIYYILYILRIVIEKRRR